METNIVWNVACVILVWKFRTSIRQPAWKTLNCVIYYNFYHFLRRVYSIFKTSVLYLNYFFHEHNFGLNRAEVIQLVIFQQIQSLFTTLLQIWILTMKFMSPFIICLQVWWFVAWFTFSVAFTAVKQLLMPHPKRSSFFVLHTCFLWCLILVSKQ